MANQEANLDDPQGDFLTGFGWAIGIGLGLLGLVAATAYGFKFINDYEAARIVAKIAAERRWQDGLNAKISAHYSALLTNVQRGPVTVLIDGERAMSCRAPR